MRIRALKAFTQERNGACLKSSICKAMCKSGRRGACAAGDGDGKGKGVAKLRVSTAMCESKTHNGAHHAWNGREEREIRAMGKKSEM